MQKEKEIIKFSTLEMYFKCLPLSFSFGISSSVSCFNASLQFPHDKNIFSQ